MIIPPFLRELKMYIPDLRLDIVVKNMPNHQTKA